MKVNVIGDIHGRICWKDLVDDSAINVFVGDYFDPYDRTITFTDLAANFIDIVNYKYDHPDNVILLYGNHDLHYVDNSTGKSTRYNWLHATEISNLFKENADAFYGIAYAPDSKYIITHAGITKDWVMLYFPELKVIPSTFEIANMINRLWIKNKYAFSFSANCDEFDTYGVTPTQSPIWVRPITLINYNFYRHTDIVQIVGHTMVKQIVSDCGIIFVDCLDCKKASYTFNTEK